MATKASLITVIRRSGHELLSSTALKGSEWPSGRVAVAFGSSPFDVDRSRHLSMFLHHFKRVWAFPPTMIVTGSMFADIRFTSGYE